MRTLHSTLCFIIGLLCIIPYVAIRNSIKLYYARRMYKANKGLAGFNWSRCWTIADSMTLRRVF